jgi:hypothetical protein
MGRVEEASIGQAIESYSTELTNLRRLNLLSKPLSRKPLPRRFLPSKPLQTKPLLSTSLPSKPLVNGTIKPASDANTRDLRETNS